MARDALKDEERGGFTCDNMAFCCCSQHQQPRLQMNPFNFSVVGGEAANVLVDPPAHAGNTRVYAWQTSSRTPNSPGHDANMDRIAVLVDKQRPAGITLARIFTSNATCTYHAVGDTAESAVALPVADNVNVNFPKHAGA